eukprot:scaffold273457_cov20-Prasinocladus_malaysianus.AAC.1
MQGRLAKIGDGTALPVLRIAAGSILMFGKGRIREDRMHHNHYYVIAALDLGAVGNLIGIGVSGDARQRENQNNNHLG